MENDISQAVVSFLGFGTAPSPRENRRGLIHEFGAVCGAELENEVASLLDELSKIQVDWSAHSLASAGELASDYMRTHHTGLSDAAIRALAWKFTFDWR